MGRRVGVERCVFHGALALFQFVKPSWHLLLECGLDGLAWGVQVYKVLCTF